MQAYDSALVSSLIGFAGALLGGVVARFAIKRLETKERETEGAFSALLGLALARELVRSFPSDLPSDAQLSRIRNLREDSAQLLITAAGKAHKTLREGLYLLGLLIQRGLEDPIPSEIRKGRIQSRVETIETRIKEQYLGGSALKELAMSVEDVLEAFIDGR